MGLVRTSYKYYGNTQNPQTDFNFLNNNSSFRYCLLRSCGQDNIQPQPLAMTGTYNFSQEKGQETLKHIQQTLEKCADEINPFIRFSDVHACADYSMGAVHAALQELLDREMALQIGCRYVPMSVLEDLDLHQLNKLRKQADLQAGHAARVQERIEKTLELRKEQLEQLRGTEHKELIHENIQAVKDLEKAAAYMKTKFERNSHAAAKIFRMCVVKARQKSGKTEKSSNTNSNKADIPHPILA